MVLGVFALVLLGLGLWAKVYFYGISTPQGWRELRALRRDPMADYDPPHTKLRSRSQQAHDTRDVFGHDDETEIRKSYEILGKPGRAVASVDKAATLAGWRFIEATCSVPDKEIHQFFDKRLGAGFTAQMFTRVELPGGPYRGEYRRLSITLWRNDIELDSVPKPQTRKDISCLDGSPE